MAVCSRRRRSRPPAATSTRLHAFTPPFQPTTGTSRSLVGVVVHADARGAGPTGAFTSLHRNRVQHARMGRAGPRPAPAPAWPERAARGGGSLSYARITLLAPP